MVVCGHNGHSMNQPVQHHPELRLSNLQWLRKLKLSIVLSLWMLPLTIVPLFFVFLFPPDIWHFISLFIEAAVYVPGWLLSSPEPRTENQPPDPNIRKILRIWTVISLGLILISKMADMIHPQTRELMLVARTTIDFVYSFCWFYYLRSLALRIPDRKLAGFTSLNLWFYVVFFSIFFLAQIISLSSKPLLKTAVCATMPTSTPTPELLGLILFGTSICLFYPVVLAFFYTLFNRFYRAFAQAIQYQIRPKRQENPAPASAPPKTPSASGPAPPRQI
jgi:hypothetical protein